MKQLLHSSHDYNHILQIPSRGPVSILREAVVGDGYAFILAQEALSNVQKYHKFRKFCKHCSDTTLCLIHNDDFKKTFLSMKIYPYCFYTLLFCKFCLQTQPSSTLRSDGITGTGYILLLKAAKIKTYESKIYNPIAPGNEVW